MKTLVAAGDLPERRPDWVPLRVVATTTSAGRVHELGSVARRAAWVELDLQTGATNPPNA